MPIKPKQSRVSRRYVAKNRIVAGQGSLVERPQYTNLTDNLRLPSFPSSVFNVIISREDLNGLVSSITLDTFTSTAFTATSFGNFTDYVAGFDQYRICMIEARYRPVSNLVAPGSNVGEVNTVIDYDDSNALTTIAQALQYDNCITASGYQPIIRTFKPRIAMAAYSGVFTSFANMPADTWLDVASPGILYYGLKTAWNKTSVVSSYDVIYRAHFQFRCAR
jgi:hypothetical protein